MSLDDQHEKDALQSLIAAILEAEGQGETVDREAHIQANPDHADSLREFFASHDQMKSAADMDAPTLQPRSALSESERPIISPGTGPLDDPTLPPTTSDIDDPTLPSTEGAPQMGETTVGDKVRYFGDYELLEEIARGGMGVVYKARQMNLNRTVALKMILAGQFAGEEDVQRFHTEAEAAAQLDHPGIVPIFEIGEHQGQHYFSMGYVDGESLAQTVAGGPLPAEESAMLMLRICEAVEYAHQRGVIHRDLKPTNILLDENGQPKVTDFGLAKRTESESDLTGTGQILGTPAYMPPEQAAGKTDEVGPLADVYSLGAILYCLLTGRPPFQAASPLDTLLQVLDREPVSPRTLNAKIPQDIETICTKCLSKERKQRYSSAEDLRGDIQRFVNGEPILARPVGAFERGWRWCKRKPVVAALSAAFLVSLIVGTAASAYFGVLATERAEQAEANLNVARQETRRADSKAEEAKRNLELATRKAAEALSEKTRAERQLYNNLIALAQQELSSNNVAQVERLLENCPQEYRNFEWRYLWHASHGYLVDFAHHTSLVTTVAVSADERLVATSGADRVIWIWKLDSGEVVRRLAGHTGNVADVAFSPDSKLLASASWDQTVRIWDVQSGRLVHTYTGHNNQVKCVAFSPDGNLIASGSRNSAIHLWHVNTWKRAAPVLQHSGSVSTIDFSTDGALLASGGSDKIVRLWSILTGKKLREFRGHTHFINDVGFSPDGKLLASSCLNDPVFLWDVEEGTKAKQLGDASVNAQAIQFTTGSLATSSGDGAIRLWSHRSNQVGEPSSVIPGHVGPIHALAFCPDSRRLVSSGEDSTAKVWDLYRHPQSVTTPSLREAIVFAAQGKRLIRTSSENPQSFHQTDRTCDLTLSRISDFRNPTKIGQFDGWINCIAEGPSDLIAVGSVDGSNTGRITIWRLGEQQPIADVSVTNSPVRMIFSRDGTRLISSHTIDGRQHNVAIFDASDGKIIHRMGPYRGTAHLLDFNDATNRIVVGQVMEGNQLKIQICDARSGEIIRHLEPGGFTWCARFSPDGSQLCTAGSGVSNATTKRSFEIKLWDPDSGELIRTLHGHQDNILAVAYSPDGTRLASKDDAKQLLIWDVDTGVNLLKLPSKRGKILDFSPDGSCLLSCAEMTSTLYETGQSRSNPAKPGGEELVPLEILGRHVMTPPAQISGFLLGRPHDYWMQAFSKPPAEFQPYSDQLAKAGDEAFPLIEKAFGGPSRVVENALNCLSRIELRGKTTIPPAMVSLVHRQLAHRDPIVRLSAIGFYRRLDSEHRRDPQGLTDLIELTGSGDGPVKNQAIRTLSFWIGTVDTAKLETVLREPDSPTGRGVASALHVRAYRALHERFEPLGFDDSSEILEILINAVRRRDPVLLDTALITFTALGPAAENAVEVLIELLDPSELDQCFRVIGALQRIGKAAKPAVPRLISLAGNSNRSIRWEVASALTAIDADAHQELVARATSDQPHVEDDNGDSLRITRFDPPLPLTSDQFKSQGLTVEFLCTLKSGNRGNLSAVPLSASMRLPSSSKGMIPVNKGGPTKKTAWFRTEEAGSVDTLRLELRVNDQRASPSLTLDMPLQFSSRSSEAMTSRVQKQPNAKQNGTGPAVSARSAPLAAYESFLDGSIGAKLIGRPGSTGFKGQWHPGGRNARAADNYSLAEGSLIFPGLLSSGNHLQAAVTTDNISGIRLSFEKPLGPADQSCYLSFLIRPEGQLGEGIYNGFFGVQLESGSNGLLFFGRPGGGKMDRYVIESSGGRGQVVSNVEPKIGEVAFLVVKLEFKAGQCRSTLIVNPTPGKPEPASNVVKQVGIPFPDGLVLYSSGAYSIDEIRIGSTFAEVTPTAQTNEN